VFEDWLFHALLPFTAYATLAASAFVARAHPYAALFGVASAAYQHLTRCETLTPTLKHHFDGSAHARLHMFRSSRSG
jgi:hypothetical protein